MCAKRTVNDDEILNQGCESSFTTFQGSLLPSVLLLLYFSEFLVKIAK